MGDAPGPGILRWLAALLVRGEDARFVRAELEEAMQRDRMRGIPLWRARWRYLVNTCASAVTLLGSRGRRLGPRISWLDVKLGLRLLVKYPALTLVAMSALAFGIPIGLAPMHLTRAATAPLPVHEGERIRVVRYWNTATSRPEAPGRYEFERWREELTTFDRLGAVRVSDYNVGSADGRVGPVAGAEVTGSVFDILRVPPLLGRTLGTEDESVDAPPVVVLGHDLWQSRFGADPGIVGRLLRIGGAPHTVVGVMPEEFLFPFRHQMWLPLRGEPAGTPLEGSALTVLGRLEAGVSSERVEAEVSEIGRRMVEGFPETLARFQLEVVGFAVGTTGIPKGGLRDEPALLALQSLALLVLLVVCLNVGMLLFARTATRSRELAVRAALGASRTRILAQLFIESLVLAVVAAGLGLLAGEWMVRSLLAGALDLPLMQTPYWVDPTMTPETVLWALGLASISAVATGVIPGIRLTGTGIEPSIRRARAKRSGTRFGGLIGALVVVDVAVAVGVIGFALGLADTSVRALEDRASVGIQADRFLAARVGLPSARALGNVESGASSGLEAPMGDVQRRLAQRLAAESGVRGVAMGSTLPRMFHPVRTAEIAGMDEVSARARGEVRTARVDPGFFDALGVRIQSGRDFGTSDLGDGVRPVIVNTAFVDQLLGGRSPLGQDVRYSAPDGHEDDPWHRIVGVVEELGTNVLDPSESAGVYHPLAPGELQPIWIAIGVGSDPASFVPRLREIAGEVDARLVIDAPMPLDQVVPGDWYLNWMMTYGGGVLVVVLLALATSTLYAMMAHAVAERTHELGIRAALGAGRGRIVLTIARRSFAQIGLGALLGMPLAAFLFLRMGGDAGGGGTAVLAAVVPGICVMVLVGLLACTHPTVRALRIAPVEALKGSV